MLNTLLSLSALPFIFTGGYSSYTSWSTSLNLLFFYITWSTLLFSHSALKIEVIGSLVIRLLFFWGPAFVFLLFDSLVPSLAGGIKFQGREGLMTGKKGKGWNTLREKMKMVMWATGNLLLGVAVQGGLEWVVMRGWKGRGLLRISSRLPLPGEILWDVARGVVVRELLTYYLHRFLLHRHLLPLHQTWSHQHPAPSSFSAHSDHPICHLLTRTLPLYLPASIFHFHLLTYFIFLALISIEEVVSYSGYSVFRYSVLGGATRRVDAHYAGLGNYGVWGVLDWIHGTSVGKSEDERMEKQLQEEREEVGDMVREVVEKVVEKRRGRSLGGEKRAGSVGGGGRGRERERERD
ncbi:sterol desaturase family [Pyronema omphalodes]|nr:sterol desaturase family [Pyronema omphalodes]